MEALYAYIDADGIFAGINVWGDGARVRERATKLSKFEDFVFFRVAFRKLRSGGIEHGRSDPRPAA